MTQVPLPYTNGASANGASPNGASANGASANGASAYPPQAWLKQTVQQFFNTINWDNHPLEIQNLRLAKGGCRAASLLLTVDQFFSTINWEGDAAAPLKPAAPTPTPAPTKTDRLTLDDFSDLF